MIFKNFADQDLIAFNFTGSGLDSDWEISQGPAILQIWESNTCSDSGYNHRSNRNFPMFLPKKWPHRLLLLPKRKIDSGPGPVFHKFFTPDPGPKEKPRILPESTPVIRIWSHLWRIGHHDHKTNVIFFYLFCECFRNKSESVSEMKINFFKTKMFVFRKHLRNESVFKKKVKLLLFLKRKDLNLQTKVKVFPKGK